MSSLETGFNSSFFSHRRKRSSCKRFHSKATLTANCDYRRCRLATSFFDWFILVVVHLLLHLLGRLKDHVLHQTAISQIYNGHCVCECVLQCSQLIQLTMKGVGSPSAVITTTSGPVTRNNKAFVYKQQKKIHKWKYKNQSHEKILVTRICRDV